MPENPEEHPLEGHPLTNVALRLLRTPDMSLRNAARLYGLAGLAIFPLWPIRVGPDGSPRACACPQDTACGSPGKHPLTKNGLTEATSDLDIIWSWWRRWPYANIGLAAGANGLAVLDVDPRHDGDTQLSKLDAWCGQRTGEIITATLTARTGGGGLHYFYQAPDAGVRSRARAFGPSGTGLDTRGTGGYVVAPPSKGLTDGYQFLAGADDVGVTPWPQALAAAITAAHPVRQAGPYVPNAGGKPRGWAGKVLMGECAAVAALEEGGRSVGLNRHAYKVGQVVGAELLDAEQAYTELLAAALSTGLSEREAHRDITNGLAAGAQKPRGPAVSAPLPSGVVR